MATGGATVAGGCCAAALNAKDIARRQAARNRETVLSCKRLVSPFANLKGRVAPGLSRRKTRVAGIDIAGDAKGRQTTA
jgi:hypothetical protein